MDASSEPAAALGAQPERRVRHRAGRRSRAVDDVSLSTVGAARCSASSASPAAARASPRCRSWGCCPVRPAASAAARSSSRARTCSPDRAGRCARIRGSRIVDDLPGADDVAQPGLHVGDQLIETIRVARAARRSAAARRRAVEMLDEGRHPLASAAARRLSAPALRRHAPAGDDRDRAGLHPELAARRRADDGARRDHPGADPRPAAARCSRSSAWR